MTYETQPASPFVVETPLLWVARPGPRNGYIQLAPKAELTQYQDVSPELFLLAHQWAIALEKHGAKRVYWITLSEMLPHLHIHLYPRWQDGEPQGLPLFEQRETAPQPSWNPPIREALRCWAEANQVYLLPQDGS